MTQHRRTLDELLAVLLPEAVAAETILVLQHGWLLRGAIRSVLREAGYRVMESDSTSEALRLIEGEEVHILVADVTDPVIARWMGMTLRSGALVEIGVVGLVGAAMRGTPGQWLLDELDGTLRKPVSPQALLAEVGRQVTAQRLRRASSRQETAWGSDQAPPRAPQRRAG